MNAPETSERKPRILVVDDDELVLPSVEAVLAESFPVDATLSPTRALDILSEGRHDILLADLMMDEMHGLELIRNAKAFFPDLIAIVMTGYGTKSAAVEALKGGVTDFLEKPLTPELLMRTIERAWKSRAVELENLELARRLSEEQALRLSREREDRLRAELAQAEKFAALGELASGVAHEINNPLQIVSGYAEMLATLKGIPERGLDCVNRIMKATDRACAIVSKLQAFSRKDFLEVKPCAINLCVEEALSLLEPQLAVHNVRVFRDFGTDIPLIRANSAELEQIVTNLMINARDAMPDGGSLTLRTRRNGNDVVVEVHDTGQGMGPDVIEKIFNPFFSTKAGGSGLGLALVLNMLRRARGQIAVDSKPGDGTKFTLTFTAESAPVEPAPAPAVRATERPLKVLVVDDETDIREICRSYLESEKHHVREASDGDEALNWLGSERFDLLLMDVKMPGRGGLSVLREMQHAHGGTPVVLMTGVVRSAPEAQGIYPNLVAVLRKPFRRNDLMDVLARVSVRSV
jgi:signal transduction histidine kinase